MPLLKVGLTFAVMLAGMRFKVGLWQSILLGGLVLGFGFGLSPGELGSVAVRALTDAKTLYLSAIVGLIMVLSDILERSGQSRRLVVALSGHLKNKRLRLIFFPALIGLLPMPGGAVFSAPMVHGVSEGMEIKAEDKVLLNYWFRHVWEFCWPLYPGIILASSLAGVPLGQLVLYAAPGSVALFLLGWIFLLRPGALPIAQALVPGEKERGTFREILSGGLPLTIAIVCSLLLEALIPLFFPAVDFEWGILAGLSLSIVTAVIQNRLGIKGVRDIVFRRHLLRMLLVVAAIFVFKECMHAAGVVGALSQMAGGRSVLLVSVIVLPFLVGMVGGIAIAFIGATFPLILGLLEHMGLGSHLMPVLILGLFSGFAGVMGSPMHICFVLSCEFFGVDVLGVWRRLVPPCTGLILFGWVYYLILT